MSNEWTEEEKKLARAFMDSFKERLVTVHGPGPQPWHVTMELLRELAVLHISLVHAEGAVTKLQEEVGALKENVARLQDEARGYA